MFRECLPELSFSLSTYKANVRLGGIYTNYVNLYLPLETQFSEFGVSHKARFLGVMQTIASRPLHFCMPGPGVPSATAKGN